MPQIRKFEQDAIVDSTISTIIADKDETIKQLKATKEYRHIENKLANLVDLKEQNKILERSIRDEKDNIEDVVKYFNTNVLNSNPIYKLEFDSWRYSKSDGLSFNLEISSYGKAGKAIQNEIAIALLPKDAVNDINSIIERIADKFRIDLWGS